VVHIPIEEKFFVMYVGVVGPNRLSFYPAERETSSFAIFS
jgi:hypothetical protein